VFNKNVRIRKKLETKNHFFFVGCYYVDQARKYQSLGEKHPTSIGFAKTLLVVAHTASHRETTECDDSFRVGHGLEISPPSHVFAFGLTLSGRLSYSALQRVRLFVCRSRSQRSPNLWTLATMFLRGLHVRGRIPLLMIFRSWKTSQIFLGLLQALSSAVGTLASSTCCARPFLVRLFPTLIS